MNKNYVTCKKMKYQQEEVWFPLSEDILAWEIDFHELMLNDKIRMVAYEKAIKEAVKPGMVVLDIGTGTGILSLWALEAGAARVYGIDVNKKILTKAHERIKNAGFSDKYITYNDLSYNVELPEKVDIVISEILGNLADNEDMTPILEDARKRFLKKNGIFLPRQLNTFLVPVSSEKCHEQITKMKCKGVNSKYSLKDLLKKLNLANQFNLYYDAIMPVSSYLSEPQIVRAFYFGGLDRSEYEVERVYKIDKDSFFTGFAGFFVANLTEKTVLDISGDDIDRRETSDCWKHCYMPIEEPFQVKVGDQILITFERYYPKSRSSVFRQCYSWSGRIIREGKTVGKFSQKTGSDR